MSYPHRLLTLAAVLGVVALTAACASSSGRAGGDNGTDIPPTWAGTADSGPAPLTDDTPPATASPAPVTPATGRRERVARWQLADRSDGRRLLVDVQVGGPPCDTVTGVDVAETATSVTVTVHAGRLPSADCPEGVTGALATARVEATLERPLGDRQLLGGS
jgi:hypothetical protein